METNQEIQQNNMLVCCRCKKSKPISEFTPRHDRPRGYHYNCKECARAERKNPRYRKLNNIRTKEYLKRLRETDPEKYYQKCRKSNLKKYNLTIEEYDSLLQKQNGVCAICGKPPEDSCKKSKYSDDIKLHIDHDHETGRVRGLLCTKCNFGIGSFSDDIDLMLDAVYYVHNA